MAHFRRAWVPPVYPFSPFFPHANKAGMLAPDGAELRSTELAAVPVAGERRTRGAHARRRTARVGLATSDAGTAGDRRAGAGAGSPSAAAPMEEQRVTTELAPGAGEPARGGACPRRSGLCGWLEESVSRPRPCARGGARAHEASSPDGSDRRPRLWRLRLQRALGWRARALARRRSRSHPALGRRGGGRARA